MVPPHLKRLRSATLPQWAPGAHRPAATLPPLPQHQSPRDPPAEPNAIKDAILRYLEALP